MKYLKKYNEGFIIPIILGSLGLVKLIQLIRKNIKKNNKIINLLNKIRYLSEVEITEYDKYYLIRKGYIR